MNRDVCEHFNPVDLPCDKCKPASVQKSTLREAAQQALAALELDAYGEPPRHERNAAITALRAALAEPVQSAEANIGCLGMPVNTPVTPPQRTAEPVQEPVAWRWGYRSITTGEMDWRGYVEIAADPNLRSPAIIMQPLYTAPPQRKPLSEEEIRQIALDTPIGGTNFARAIERAHGIRDSDE